MLRKTPDVDLHRLHLVQLLDTVLREHVHHSRCDTAIGNDGAAGLSRPLLEALLLKHDLGVPTEVAEVRAGFSGEPGQIEIEVVWNRAHGRVRFAHQRTDRLVITDVEVGGNEPGSRVWTEEFRKVI